MKFKKKIFEIIYNRRYNIIKKNIEKEFKKGIILDAGCGSGPLLPLLRNSGMVIGLDLFPYKWGKEAKENLKFINNVSLIKGNIFKLPFNSNLFDVVVVSSVLEHLEDIEKAIDEIVRVLSINGTLIAGMPRENLFYKFARLIYFGTWNYKPDLRGDDHFHTSQYLKKIIEKKISQKKKHIVFGLWEIISYKI